MWQQDSAPAPTLQAQGEEGGAGTAVGVIVTILILSLTITVTVYYRKRFHSLKTQMSHVHYSSSSHNNQPGQCQPHHFDNPVYATCRARATTITTPGSLNNGRVHNTIVKDTNKCRDKFNTLPPGSLRHMARCMEEEELSDDTNSEKGLSVTRREQRVTVTTLQGLAALATPSVTLTCRAGGAVQTCRATTPTFCRT